MRIRKTQIEFLNVILILFIGVIVFTWPMVLYLSRAIPSGSEPPAVAIAHLSLIEWTGKVLEGEGSYWNAPFFYPYEGSYAWWETQPFTCFLIWLIGKLTGYILAYNIVIILYLVGFGLVGYATARLLTSDRVAALWPALWLIGSAYVLQQLCAIALIAAVFPLACFYFSLRFAENNDKRFFWLAVLMFIITWGTCKQYALFVVLLLPSIILPFLSWKKIDWPTLAHFTAALLVIAVVTLPYSLKQLAYTKAMGFSWALEDVKVVLALKDLFMPAKGHWLWTHMLNSGGAPESYSRDIGLVALVVVILALCVCDLRFRQVDRYKKKMVIGLLSMILAALLLGFGSKAGVVIGAKKYSLYALLFSFIPPFSFVRSPARFVIFAVFGIAVISALAFAYLRSRIRDRNKRLVISAFLFALLFAEMWTMPIPLVFPQEQIDSHIGAINWLHNNGGGQPVVELPVSVSARTAERELEAGAIFRMLNHANPIINGYVSFSPFPYKQLRIAMVTDPANRGRRYIEAYGARYAFVHKDRLSDKKEEKELRKALGDDIVFEDARDVIYLLSSRAQRQDISQILPASAKFDQRPQKGKIYALSLPQPLNEAVLIMPRSDWVMKFKWPDGKGNYETKKFRIRGSVILDIAPTRLFFQITHIPKGDGEGEARVISPEEAWEFLKQGKYTLKSAKPEK